MSEVINGENGGPAEIFVTIAVNGTNVWLEQEDDMIELSPAMMRAVVAALSKVLEGV